MMKIKILLLISCLFVITDNKAQLSRVNNPNEVQRLVEYTIDAGYSIEECLEYDSSCYYINLFQKEQFLKLGGNNLDVYKIFPILLFKEIRSFDFVDSFEQYFRCDTSIYNIIFCENYASSKKLIGSIMYNKEGAKFGGNSSSLESEDYFINSLDFDKSLLFYPMRFEHYYLVEKNKMYFIVDKHLVPAKEYFQNMGYDFKELNWRFFGNIDKKRE